MSIMLFVILLHLLVARAINTRVESPPRLVLLTGRRYSETCSVTKARISTFKHRTVPSYEAQKSASVERRPHRSPEMPWRTW